MLLKKQNTKVLKIEFTCTCKSFEEVCLPFQSESCIKVSMLAKYRL